MSTPSLPETIKTKIDGYRHRRRIVSFLWGVFLTLAIFVGAVTLAIVADRLLRLPPIPRNIFRIAIVAAFGFCMVRWVIVPTLRRLSDHKAAVRLGHHFPDKEEDLVTAVELSNNANAIQGVSESLILSALRGIVDRTRDLNIGMAVPMRPVLETAGVFIIVAIILGTGFLLQPEAVRNAIERLLRADDSVPFHSYVKLDVFPGNKVIARGDVIRVRGDISGRKVSEARFEANYRGDRIRHTLTCTHDEVRWQSAQLHDDLQYRLKAGDALSDWYRIRVVPAPSLDEKKAVLQWPDYAKSHIQELSQDDSSASRFPPTEAEGGTTSNG